MSYTSEKNDGHVDDWESGNKSLREIGKLFGRLDYAAVAHGFAEQSPIITQLLHGG